ncbi:hypothetical protein D3C85_1278510 [compost metagenome]
MQAGTLIGNSASIRGNLLNYGSVIFDQSLDGTVSSFLIGTGAITKRGTGTLTLDGLNTLDWNNVHRQRHHRRGRHATL